MYKTNSNRKVALYDAAQTLQNFDREDRGYEQICSSHNKPQSNKKLYNLTKQIYSAVRNYLNAPEI